MGLRFSSSEADDNGYIVSSRDTKDVNVSGSMKYVLHNLMDLKKEKKHF